MPLYRRKPLPPIEAEQVSYSQPDAPLPRGVQSDGSMLYVTDIQGRKLEVHRGDWIIPESDGVHHYPCSVEEFAARYELVDAPPAETPSGPNCPACLRRMLKCPTNEGRAAWVCYNSDCNDIRVFLEPVDGEKTLHNSDISGARVNVPDIKVVGNGDLFQLLAKASSQREGWMKSTKAMQVPGGCVVQVTTQQKNPDGTYAGAEALTFVPGVQIENDVNGGRRLVAEGSGPIDEDEFIATRFSHDWPADIVLDVTPETRVVFARPRSEGE